MQNFKTLRQPLMGELAMSRKKKERETNAIYSGHLRFCLQPKGSARTPLGPISPLKSLFEPDSSKKTSDTLIELAVPTITNLSSAPGTNPPICVDQIEVRRGLSMSIEEAWTGHRYQDWLQRTWLGQDGPTRM